MKKLRFQLALVGTISLLTAPVSAQDVETEFAKIQSGSATAISPNGKYVVGIGSTYDNQKFSSFLWDSTTKKVSLTTTFDENDLSKGGMFNYVNNNGIVAGASKDKNLNKYNPGDDWSDPYMVYFVNATVWKDGKPTYLGIGDQTTDDLSEEYDGSYAVSVSEDGKTIAGYIYKSYMPAIACGWKYNDTTGEYDYYRYAVPAADALSTVNAMSSDGKVAVGNVLYGGCRRPVVWTATNTYKEIDLSVATDESLGGDAAAVSADGKYALVYVNAQKAPKLAVYDVAEDKLNDIKLPDAYSVKGLAIDNSGNFFCTITDNNYATKTYYYSANDKSLVTMDYFMETFAPELTDTELDNTSLPASMSADGKCVAGNSGSYGVFTAWFLKMNYKATLINAVENVRIYHSGINKLTVNWSPLAKLPEGYTLKSYIVYVNGTVKTTVDAKDGTAAEYSFDATAGNYEAYVVATCAKGDKLVTSAASETVTATIPSSYAMPIIEDFEAQQFEKNFWTNEIEKADLSKVMKWNISGGNVYDYENPSYFASTTSISNEPFEVSLISRFMDAANVSKPYLALYGNLTYVNVTPKAEELTSDFLDIQYSLDGKTWKTLKSICAKDVTPYVWSFYKVDLDELAGRAFQVRFNAHGEGKAQLRWCIDYVTFGTELSKAPEGVKAVKSGDSVEVTWENSFGAYEVSYLSNSNVIPCYNIGNEGKPLIVAVDMPTKKLVNYTGKYITSVSSFIYDDQTMGSTLKTQAEAIVYEEGVEVSRQAFDENVSENAYSSTALLSKPVQIKEGKNYRIAVRIYDYDSQQSPLYYQASKEYKAGTTDLYSEDEGKTWSTIYEFNKNNEDEARAMCIWPIRANITETATVEGIPQLDGKLMAYNVYRDGKKVNNAAIFAAQPTFTDKNGNSDAKYTVQAFYTDGRVSEISEPCSITVSAIDNAFSDEEMNVAINGNRISINNSFDWATLVSANGQNIGYATADGIDTTGLAKGVYILTVSKKGKKSTYKLLVK